MTRHVPTVLVVLFLLALGPARGAGQAPGHELLRSASFVARRNGVSLVVELQGPHRVLSTSIVGGGLREDVGYIANTQSMEARGHMVRLAERIRRGHRRHHDALAQGLGLSGESVALMGTAASMDHVAHATASHGELRVDALVTAGVHGNAVAAGDPASYYQRDGRVQKVERPGTINVIVLINQPVAPGAMVKVASVATEAKSGALWSLAVASRKSTHLATGTGTDQLAVAAPLEGSVAPLASASQHVKLGELVGRSVRAAVTDALRRQNGLTTDATRRLTHALGRFGVTPAVLRRALRRRGDAAALLLLENLEAIDREPRVAAAGYALAALLERIEGGALEGPVASSALRDHVALLAVAVSQRPDSYPALWLRMGDGSEGPAALVVDALMVGMAAKWEPPAEASPDE